MALAETISRKIHKLGLVPKLIKLLPIVSILLAISSISWILILPLNGNYRNTYISENALMPSQVTSFFRESEWNIVRGYREEISKLENQSIEIRNNQLEKWVNDLGLVTAYHNNGKFNDTLYAIMHAPRGDDTEAMVLAIPWETSDNEYNEGGMALAIALSRYFSKMSIWSKNIIIVFVENNQFPLRSWVEAYHTSLEETAGSIEAAIVLEYGKNGDYFDYYELIYEGLNGQLPNLDLLNTVNLIGYHEGLHCAIQDTPSTELVKDTYFTRLRTLIRGIIALTLTGIKPGGGCEAFSGWQIQAFTIKARGTKGPHDVTQFGRLVDSTFRSVNNLLEKFHQSFFFYLMLSKNHFVSIGTYLPSAVLMAIAFTFSSLGTILISGLEINSFISHSAKILTIFVIIEIICFILSLTLPLIKVDISILLIILSFIPLGLKSSSSSSFKLNKTTSFGLVALSLFFISLLITALLIVHFSLALLLGLFTLPLTFLAQPKPKLKTIICLLISNPFFIISIAGQDIFLGLVTSWHDLQCWTWFVVSLGWYSAWLGVAVGTLSGDFTVQDTTKKQQ
ncbi:Gaa1-like protein [Scheffersomyces amazonensis]|uniref:Gaa1-like protein n=1 Tax=Scheffersomyces amazonensis TaxID=1078765 RepID=UPI00315D6FB0